MATVSAGGWEFDDTMWPLLRVSAPATHGDEDFDSYLALLARYRQLGQSYAILYNLGGGKGLTAGQRAKQAAYIAESVTAGSKLAGVAFIAHNAVQRGVLTAIFWIQKMPWPTKVFGSTEAAHRWLQTLLDGAAGRGARPV